MANAVKFRHKPTEVEGIEGLKILQAAANGTVGMLPRWVQDAIFEGKLEASPYKYAIVCYPLPMVPRLGSARDWVLYDPSDKTINICPPEMLEQLYDAID